MIKFKGTTLYPPALADLLTEMDEVIEFAVEVYTNETGMDEILLYLQAEHQHEDSERSIRAYLQARLRVTPQIKYLTAEEIQKIQYPGSGRKPVKFIDRRQ